MTILQVNSDMILKKDEKKSSKNEDGSSISYFKLLHKSSGRSGSVKIKSTLSSVTEKLDHTVLHKSNSAPKVTHSIEDLYLHGKGIGMDLEILRTLTAIFKDIYIKKAGEQVRPVVAQYRSPIIPQTLKFSHLLKKITLRTGEYLKKIPATDKASESWQFFDAAGNSLSPVHLFPQDSGSMSVYAPKLSKKAFMKVLRALEKYYSIDESSFLREADQKADALEKSMAEFPTRYTLKQLTWLRNLKKILADAQAPGAPLEDFRATGVLRKFRQKWWHLLISDDNSMKVKITPQEAADYEQDRQGLRLAINDLAQNGDNSLDNSMPPTINALAIF